jgi:cytochrome c peroxidase
MRFSCQNSRFLAGFSSVVILCLTGLSAQAGSWEALPKKAPAPADNPITPAKIELGRKLYFDPRLSHDGTVSCNSCHNVMSAGDDGRATSAGIRGQNGGRSAPTVWNSAFLSVQFWDGRANSLEDQAKGPLTNPIEMGMPSHDLVVGRIREIPGYIKEFEKAFGGKGPETVTIDHVAKAIATYERTLITPDTPYDQYVRGNKKALSEQQVRGMKLVETTGCLSCHMGSNFSGPALPVGTGFYQKFPVYPDADIEKKYQFTKDLGRAAVTKNDAEKNFYRVPTWRNVALTAPYFHNGAVATLDEAVRVMAKTQLNKTLTDAEVADIVAFLNGLGGNFPEQKMPRLPETPNRSLVVSQSK